MKSKKTGDPQVAEMHEETVIGTMEMCDVEVQDGSIQSTILLAIRYVSKNKLN